MYSHYFYWQFVSGPRWLLEFTWHLQLALLRFFSVPVMIRTLINHWHRDRISYQQGSISGMMRALALNTISRTVGFLIRTAVLVVWLCVQTAFIFTATSIIVLFVLWPLLTLVLFAAGIALL